jgi:hypothetical protein
MTKTEKDKDTHCVLVILKVNMSQLPSSHIPTPVLAARQDLYDGIMAQLCF